MTGFPFTLNSAVDKLLKKEFDTYRVAESAHPLFEKFGINAIPFTPEEVEEWRRTPNGGAAHLHTPTNLRCLVLSEQGMRERESRENKLRLKLVAAIAAGMLMLGIVCKSGASGDLKLTKLPAPKVDHNSWIMVETIGFVCR